MSRLRREMALCRFITMEATVSAAGGGHVLDAPLGVDCDSVFHILVGDIQGHLQQLALLVRHLAQAKGVGIFRSHIENSFLYYVGVRTFPLRTASVSRSPW